MTPESAEQLPLRDLRELRSELPEDQLAFQEREHAELARRWRIFAPGVIGLAVVSEIAPLLSPDFPPNLPLSGGMAALMLVVWGLALRRASFRVLVWASVAAAVYGGIYSGITTAEAGGFGSVHVLGMALVIGLLPGIFSLPLRASINAIGGSLAAFTVACAAELAHLHRPPDGWEVVIFYCLPLGLVTVISAERARRMRRRELIAQRIAERLHRFAVEEVMCRHLPQKYVERVLSGEHPLNAPPERRVITVLFADLVAFTPLSDALPPERLAAVMARFYEVTGKAAFDHGATIDKFIGDAVMAILGAPDPMDPEVQAARAVEVARAWHEVVASLASPAAGIPVLQLRIGIHQDTVAVGAFGGRMRSDYTVLGRGVNIAARLEQRCRPGEILISDDLFRRLSPSPADSTDLGLLELKGLPAPIRCHALGQGRALPAAKSA